MESWIRLELPNLFFDFQQIQRNSDFKTEELNRFIVSLCDNAFKNTFNSLFLCSGAKGQTSLRDILAPLVKEVLTDKNLVINTSPVEVYKQWINQMESETGKTSDLPYDVDNEFAMKQPEVVKRITASNKSLIAAADKFLNHFIKNMEKIP